MPLSGGAAPTISLKKQQTQTPTGTASDDSPFPVMHLAGLYDAAINDETGETTYNVVVLTCGPSKGQTRRSTADGAHETSIAFVLIPLGLCLLDAQRCPRFTLACL